MPAITPSLWFDDNLEDAIGFYCSIFPNSTHDSTEYYTDAGPGTPGRALSATFTLDGQKFDGASLAGKPVVFWFWAPWCPKCHYEAPAVKAAAGKYRDVAFVGVAGLDTEPEMKEFVERTKTGSLTHLSDEKGAVWTKLGVTQQSTFVFMRPDGSTSKASGPLGAETLDGHVATLLS